MICKIYSSIVTLFAWITYSTLNCLYLFLKISFLWCFKVTMIAWATKFFINWLYVTSEIVFSLCHKSTRFAREQIMNWLYMPVEVPLQCGVCWRFLCLFRWLCVMKVFAQVSQTYIGPNVHFNSFLSVEGVGTFKTQTAAWNLQCLVWNLNKFEYFNITFLLSHM